MCELCEGKVRMAGLAPNFWAPDVPKAASGTDTMHFAKADSLIVFLNFHCPCGCECALAHRQSVCPGNLEITVGSVFICKLCPACLNE